jgi:hypothetical protein
MPTRNSGRERAANDWYIEPTWAVDLLLDAMPSIRNFYDPCAGRGTIIDCGLHRGLRATGADFVDRCSGRFSQRDFLADDKHYANIVTNPPFKPAVRVIEHGLRRVRPGGIVAVFVPIGFLASQRRAELFRTHCTNVFIMSTRPSVPPGAVLEERGESARHGGSTDFCWMVFGPRASNGALIDWLVKSDTATWARAPPGGTTRDLDARRKPAAL